MNIVDQSKNLMLAMGASPMMYLLIALSIASFAVVIERLWFFHRTRDDLPLLARQLRTLLAAGDIDGAKLRMRASPSPAAAIVLAGLEQAHCGAESADEEMHGALATQRTRLERRLAFLGTLGNNAPFLGLFGTVVGIMTAFEKLGDAGRAAGSAASTANHEVMSSIAEALVATAVGLLVALPAVASFNYFQRSIKSTLARSDTLSRVLLAWLKACPEATRHTRAVQPREQMRDSSPPRMRSIAKSVAGEV